MSGSNKVYVITTDPTPSWPPRERAREAEPLRRKQQSRERRPKHPLPLFILAYATGPFAPLVLGPGRTNPFFSLLAILCALIGAGVVWRGDLAWTAFRNGSLPFLPLLAGVAAWFVLAALCWAWGVARAGRYLEGGAAFPEWIRSPGVTGLAGLLAPGAGLVLAGHRWRGSTVVAGLGPFAVGLLLVLLAPTLWRINGAHGEAGVPGITMEWVLLGAAGLVGAGILFWIVQALDGARLASPRFRTRTSRADLLPLLLLVVLAASPWFFHPSHVGGTAEGWADRLERGGMQMTPLLLVRGAAWIDPGNPLHELHAAQLHEDLGQDGAARAIREDLHRRWGTVATRLSSPGEAAVEEQETEGPELPLPVPPTGLPLDETPR